MSFPRERDEDRKGHDKEWQRIRQTHCSSMQICTWQMQWVLNDPLPGR
jgi:hypothetical protein